MRLTSVDLPTLGRPTTATTATVTVAFGQCLMATASARARPAGRRPRRCRGRWCRARPRPRALRAGCRGPAAVQLVAARDVGGDRVDVSTGRARRAPAARSLGGVAVRIDLGRALRPDDRADVAALDDDAAEPDSPDAEPPVISSRCGATSSARTAGRPTRADTAGVTGAERISPSTGSPSSRTAGCVRVGVEIDGCPPRRRRRPPSRSARSTPPAAPRASPRGTWRRCRGSARRAGCASSRATVDLPVPDGPSSATTRRTAVAPTIRTRRPSMIPTPGRGYGSVPTGPTPTHRIAHCGRSVRSAAAPRRYTCRSCGAGARRLDVGEQPQHPRHGAGHRDLGGAQQRHVGQPERRAAYAGNSAVRSGVAVNTMLMRSSLVDAVAAQYLGDQLGRAGEDLVALVVVDLDRSPDRPYRHARSVPVVTARSSLPSQASGFTRAAAVTRRCKPASRRG